MVYFGEATTFDEIECIWAILATKSMHFQFHYSDGAAGWVRFYPTDDTNGAQLNGLMHWLASDIPAWAADTVNGVVNKYWIRVTRTRLVGVGPTEDTIKFIKGVSYEWDKLGAVAVLSVSATDHIALRSNAELRFYDNGNYVGFEAPALGADQIWVLPAADGNLADVLVTDGAGNLSWSPAGAGDVTAAAVITDHSIVRGNGGAKGVQDSGILIDDNDVMTFPDGGSISLQEDITFLGATTENQIKFPDNLADALSFKEGANFYMTFVTTDAAEAVHFHKDVGIGTAVPSCPLEVQGGNLYQGTIRVDTDNAAEYSSYGWMTNGVLKWSIYNHPTADKMIWADDGGVDLMTLTQTGQLGIGTVSPIAKLCINNSTSATSGFHISHTGASTTEGLNIYYDNAGVGTIYFDSIINSATALVKFRTRTAGAPIEAITLLGDGGVFMANLKSGANQGAAGAAANELWIDTADQTIKVGV